MGLLKNIFADSAPEDTSLFERQLATTAKRFLAFMIDYTWIMLVLAGAYPFFLPEQWDRLGTGELVPHLIPVYILGVALFLLRDSFGGQSIGKAFLNLYVAKVDKELPVAEQSQRIKRNLFLVLLPVEIFFMLKDDYARRLGDKFALTLVAEVVKPPKVRRVTHKALAAMTLVSALWTLYIIGQPVAIKKTQGYAIASEAALNYGPLQEAVGSFSEFTYWPDVSYAFDHITYGLTAAGPKGEQKVEVVVETSMSAGLDDPKVARIQLIEPEPK